MFYELLGTENSLKMNVKLRLNSIVIAPFKFFLPLTQTIGDQPALHSTKFSGLIHRFTFLQIDYRRSWTEIRLFLTLMLELFASCEDLEVPWGHYWGRRNPSPEFLKKPEAVSGVQCLVWSSLFAMQRRLHHPRNKASDTARPDFTGEMTTKQIPALPKLCELQCSDAARIGASEINVEINHLEPRNDVDVKIAETRRIKSQASFHFLTVIFIMKCLALFHQFNMGGTPTTQHWIRSLCIQTSHSEAIGNYFLACVFQTFEIASTYQSNHEFALTFVNYSIRLGPVTPIPYSL